MKCKKALSLLLSLAMVLSILPMSVFAADGYGELLAEDSSGNYVDTSADPYTGYEYTIVGSDGSVQTLSVDPLDADADIVPDGIITEETAETYYERVTSLDDLVDGTYMIVNSRFYRALLPEASGSDNTKLNYVQVYEYDGDDYTYTTSALTEPPETLYVDISWANAKVDWTLLSSVEDSAYSLQNVATDGYLTFAAGSASTVTDSVDITIAQYNNGNEAHTGSFILGLNNQYLNMHGGYNGYFGGYDQSSDGGAAHYFYLKHPAGTVYTVDTSDLQALVNECNELQSDLYTTDSWADFEAALNEANTVLSGTNEFDNLDDAKTRLTTVNNAYDALLAAKEALVALVITTPTIEWQRTLEPANSDPDDIGALVIGQSFFPAESDTTYPVIEWAWGDKDDTNSGEIADLTTDSSMTVWDYNTDAQYATSITKVDGVSAATWNEHEQSSGDTTWKDASVRKFSGSFTWPSGYDFEDTAIIESVNDDNYQAIYNYINDDPDLKARFGNSKVIPINDDMYVFVYAEGDEITAENYLEHLVFWSGTSGKGIWSHTSYRNDDWGRTTPATYNNKAATPAYNQIYPNMADVDATDTTRTTIDWSKMQQSNGWYTLADTNALMSTLTNLYGTADSLADKKLYVDIYCFDNDTNGGMDELKFNFIKAPETTANVTVNYYLDSVNGTLLGSTYMNAQPFGTKITLSSGTNINELNHMRAAAVAQANGVVSYGTQQGAIPYIVVQGSNIINVVYTRETVTTTYYTYDFGVANVYSNILTLTDGVTGVTSPVSNVTVARNGNNYNLTFTPQNASDRAVVNVALTVLYSSGTTTPKYVTFIPASNVLYEENFIATVPVDGYASWTQTAATGTSVADNDNTVYGYTDAYKTCTGANGVWAAKVHSTAAEATETTPATFKRTSNLTFTFNGTGLDLIGTCGPDTGTLAVRITNSAGALEKAYLIDTSFTDGTLYQVPLLHTTDLADGVHNVTIRGSYIDYSSAATANTFSTFGSVGGGNAIADIYDLLYDLGLSDDEIDYVEYINMDKLYGASTYAVEETDSGTEGNQAPEAMTLEIDGFRVYHPTSNDNYTEDERGLYYYNALDAVSGGSDTKFAAYIEGDANGENYTVANYESMGGPQNEIYLGKNQSIAFKVVSGSTTFGAMQVAVRNVGSGTPTLNGTAINHATEMYYEVEPNADGIVIISNMSTKTEENPSGIDTTDSLLAVCNFKFAANTNAVALAEEEHPVVFSLLRSASVTEEPETPVEPEIPEEPETPVEPETPSVPEVPVIPSYPVYPNFPSTPIYPVYPSKPSQPNYFEPDNLEWKVNSFTLAGKKYVTIMVSSSSDVGKLTINGTPVWANNYLLVRTGLDDRYRFSMLLVLDKGETANFEVVAYDKDGRASTTYKITD